MNSCINELSRLNIQFQFYSLFWSEWSSYRYNGLNETDIYTLEIFRKRGFKISIDDTLMFYYKEKAISDLTEKLKLNYPEFQNWLILRFQVSLLNLTNSLNYDGFQQNPTLNQVKEAEYGLEALLEIDINKLILDNKIKNALIPFKHDTIKEILDCYTDEDFRNDEIFKKVQNFQLVINGLTCNSSAFN